MMHGAALFVCTPYKYCLIFQFICYINILKPSRHNVFCIEVHAQAQDKRIRQTPEMLLRYTSFVISHNNANAYEQTKLTSFLPGFVHISI